MKIRSISILYSGDLAYAPLSGLQSPPQTIPVSQMVGAASCLLHDEDDLYMGNSQNGIAIFDVTDPSNATFSVFIDDNDQYNAYSMDIWGSTIYACGSNSCDLVDISDPDNATWLSHVSKNGGDLVCSIVRVIDSSYALAGTSSGVDLVDIHDPQNASFIAEVTGTTGETVKDIFITGSWAYAGTYMGKCFIMDLSSLPDITVHETLQVDQHVKRVVVYKDSIYLLTSGGVRIFR